MTNHAFSHQGILADFAITDSGVEIDVKIKGWARKRRFQLKFAAGDLRQLRAALLICLDASLYQDLADDWIRKVENLSWRLFGFQRTHTLAREPDFPALAYADEVSLLGMGQSKSRPQTEVTDVFIGQRAGEQFLLLRVGHYISEGVGNMGGSSPDTAVIPLVLLGALLKRL